MIPYSEENKKAWEYDAYAFWCRECPPQKRAAACRKDPKGQLKKYASYFERFRGVRVANICGSCGKKAVPLAVLGAEVTVFDISADNKRYAMELAEAAAVHIDYELGDILELDPDRFKGYFDVVFMEGGVLHYFHDLSRFMKIMHGLLKDGGRMICSDFHPFTKILDTLGLQQPTMDYFDAAVFQGEMAHARFYPREVRESMPLCSYRKYTISEIINTVLQAGFLLERFDEHPAWEDPKLPGEFTLLARKEPEGCHCSYESDSYKL